MACTVKKQPHSSNLLTYWYRETINAPPLSLHFLKKEYSYEIARLSVCLRLNVWSTSPTTDLYATGYCRKACEEWIQLEP